MKGHNMFPDSTLPPGFRFPRDYMELYSNSFILDFDIQPWWFLCSYENHADYWYAELKRQYPGRSLIPFAKKEGSDDFACFDGEDLSGDPQVIYIHAFASAGWEGRGHANNFSDWLRLEKENSIQYMSGFEGVDD